MSPFPRKARRVLLVGDVGVRWGEMGVTVVQDQRGKGQLRRGEKGIGCSVGRESGRRGPRPGGEVGGREPGGRGRADATRRGAGNRAE